MTQNSAAGDDKGQIIQVPYDFAKHVVEVPGNGSLDMGPIERAEKALATLAAQYPVWMEDEIAALVKARKGLTRDSADKQARERLFFAAHNLRGQAQTMNFPMVGTVSENLCQFLERLPEGPLPLDVVDLHVIAIKAMVDENATGDSNGVAASLAAQLGVVSEKVLQKTRPDFEENAA